MDDGWMRNKWIDDWMISWTDDGIYATEVQACNLRPYFLPLQGLSCPIPRGSNLAGLSP